MRPLVPQVLGALVRRYGTFDECEDAVQEALLAASVQWPERGVPDNPRAWLVDGRLAAADRRAAQPGRSSPSGGRGRTRWRGRSPTTTRRRGGPSDDDSLQLLFLCCHPDLTTASQVALTLRAVGGLTTAEIAAAFLVPEATMAQRISRAKQRIRDRRCRARDARPDELPARLGAVLHVLYLVFNEGYTASSGRDLRARRPRRRGAAPDAPARSGAARRARGRRVAGADAADAGPAAGARRAGGHARAARRAGPLAVGSGLVAEGVALISATLAVGRVGPFQLQAAIAAVHDEAASAEATDWLQILGALRPPGADRAEPGRDAQPRRRRGDGARPGAGLALLDVVAADERMVAHHRIAAVRAHLLELAGDARRRARSTAARRA